MLNDLRARRFRYNELELAPVLDHLDRNAAGFADEAARLAPGHLQRVATRLPAESRTASWLIRQVMHEGRHHMHDIEEIGQAVQGSSRAD